MAHGPRQFKTVIFHHYIGAGHTAAAEAIARTREASGQLVTLIRNDDVARWPFVGPIDRGVNRLVMRNIPGLFNTMWWNSRTEEGLSRDELSMPLKIGFSLDKLEERLTSEAPDEIIVTDEFSAELMVVARSKGRIDARTPRRVPLKSSHSAVRPSETFVRSRRSYRNS